MDEVTYGIQETKELLIGVNELAVCLIQHFKDGIQLTDVMAIVDDFKTNPALLASIMAAKDKVDQVPAEIKDLTLVEGVELVMVQIQYAPKILAAAKKA